MIHQSARTLVERIERASTSASPVTFINGEEHDSTTWGELHHDATLLAAGLQSRGIRPGDHVAVLGPTTRELVTLMQAVWLAGGVLVMMPLPLRMGTIDEFVAQTRRRVLAADAAMLAIDPQFFDFVAPEPGDPQFVSFSELRPATTGLTEADFVRPNHDPDSLVILQFTSGSTSEPKGVMLVNHQLCANLDACIEGFEVREDDVALSWLPLYHDMGLVGLLLIPMTTGIGIVQAAPQDFLARPGRWMEWASQYGASATAGPNFSYVLATRALGRSEGLDLSRLRICLNGAEPVDADGFRSFLAAGAPFGLEPAASFAAFGMAELAIGGTFPKPGSGLRTDIVDGVELEHSRLAVPVPPDSPEARELVFLGRPLAGMEIRIVDPETGADRGDREVGELHIRGTSVTPGYYNRPDATDALLRGGWLHTGDLAYLVDGELVICGRIKDLIIIGGRNIFPQDIEASAAKIDEVRTGNVIAFGETGSRSKQHIVVVAETRADNVIDLRSSITDQIVEDIGVPPREVVLVPPGTIPKTSSGKLQRSACRDLYRRGELAALG